MLECPNKGDVGDSDACAGTLKHHEKSSRRILKDTPDPLKEVFVRDLHVVFMELGRKQLKNLRDMPLMGRKRLTIHRGTFCHKTIRKQNSSSCRINQLDARVNNI